MIRVLLACCLSFWACGKKEARSPGGQAGMAIYQDAGGLFSCKAPGDWRVLENQGGAQRVSFFGPPTGPGAYSVSLSVYFYPKTGEYASPQAYYQARLLAARRATPLRERAWKGKTAFEFNAFREEGRLHQPGIREKRQEDTVLLPSDGGFFAAVLSSPEERSGESAPVFQELLESFRPL